MGLKNNTTRTDQIMWAPNPNYLDTTVTITGLTTAHNVTAVAEAVGTGNADGHVSITAMSSAMTVNQSAVAAPGDPRVIFERIAARLSCTASTNPNTLHCRVYIDAQDASHRLFDVSWTGTTAQLFVKDEVPNGATGNGAGFPSTAVFNNLLDGGVHTLYFFFWNTSSGTATITANSTELWYGVGTAAASLTECLEITFSGLASVAAVANRIGTGSINGAIVQGPLGNPMPLTSGQFMSVFGAYNSSISLQGYTSVATDICYLTFFDVVLKY